MMKKWTTMILTLVAFEALPMFTSMECVSQSFSGSFAIEKGPFGLLPLKMNVKKNRCIIDIEYDVITNTHWIIDLCREPVHIKKNSWSGDGFQIRKNYPCKDETTYCQQVDELLSNIENEALIYAKGERETLTTDHGKFFCTYLLLKNYLKEGKVFSLTVPDSINIFEKTLLESFGQKTEVTPNIAPTDTTETPVPTTTGTVSPTQVKF